MMQYLLKTPHVFGNILPLGLRMDWLNEIWWSDARLRKGGLCDLSTKMAPSGGHLSSTLAGSHCCREENVYSWTRHGLIFFWLQ
jgi:hypothetical protein